MYNQTIFSIFFFVSGLFNFTIVHSQSGSIKTPGILQSYLGKIGASDYFVANPLDYKQNNSVVLSFKNGVIETEKLFTGTLSLSEVYKVGNKNQNTYHYTDWFIHKNNVYSIFQIKTETAVELTLYKYDSNLNTIDSISIFRESIQNHRDFNFFFKQIDNQIGIIAPFELSTTNFFSLIYDLNSKEQTIRFFNFNECKEAKCTDFSFNLNQDVLAVFEGPENYRVAAVSSIDESKILNFIIYSLAEEVKFKKIESLTETEYSRSFKIHKLNENEILLGGLNFHSTGGKNIKGYRTSFIKFGEGEENKLSKSDLNGLDNPELWLNKNGEKFETNKYDYITHYQHLKEIIPLGNGNFIFISEAHSTLKTAGIDPTSSFSSGKTSTLNAPKEPNYFNGSQTFQNQENRDIFVSNLNPNEGTLKWSTKTKNRLEMINIKSGFGLKAKSYFVDINEELGNITFLYADYPNNFDKKAKGGYMTTSNATTIAKFQISLSTGDSKTTEFTPKLITEDLEAFSIASSYKSENGQVILNTQSRNTFMTKFYIKFHSVQF